MRHEEVALCSIKANGRNRTREQKKTTTTTMTKASKEAKYKTDTDSLPTFLVLLLQSRRKGDACGGGSIYLPGASATVAISAQGSGTVKGEHSTCAHDRGSF